MSKSYTFKKLHFPDKTYYAKQSLLQDIQLPNAPLSLNSQGMSGEKQVPQTTNINSVGELTCGLSEVINSN